MQANPFVTILVLNWNGRSLLPGFVDAHNAVRNAVDPQRVIYRQLHRIGPAPADGDLLVRRHRLALHDAIVVHRNAAGWVAVNEEKGGVGERSAAVLATEQTRLFGELRLVAHQERKRAGEH